MNTFLYMFKIMLLSAVVINNVWAHDDETHYDRIHLTANATAQLENDTMEVTVFAEEEGSEAAELASVVNKRIRWGIALIKQHPEIKHQTNAYSSNPIYNKNKIKGWRVRQSLKLKSQDMALMSDVLGELQKTLALQSMQFTISPDSRNRQDKELIDEALEAFKTRAKQIVKNLDRNNYKIVDINISTSGAGVVRPQYAVRSMMMDSVESSPAISAGEQTVSVTVNGSIELE